MRLPLKSLWLVPALLLGACGPTTDTSGPPSAPATQAQGVLYAPPAPVSGNILDSTAYLGTVAVPGSVQTRFTTNPQYLSFSFNARAGAQVKLEVTHLGSSMYLDTGLFVYGPKDASGSYGTTVRAQNDDDGYGELSKLASFTAPTQGEYLVVVSSGTGSGKQFRLQADCLSGTCTPVVDPSVYSTCDLYAATRLEECVQGHAEEIDPVLGRRMTTQEAYDTCTSPTGAHENYTYVCNGFNGGEPAPSWCVDGEAPFTELMWPVCKDFYKYYYGLYTLTLASQPLSANLQSKVAAGNSTCQAQNYSTCSGALAAYSFAWTSTAQPRLDKAVEAVATQRGQEAFNYWRQESLTYAQFAAQVNPDFQLDPALLTDLGNGTEAVQVQHLSDEAMTAPDYCEWYDTYILLFPQSHKVVTFDYTFGRDC